VSLGAEFSFEEAREKWLWLPLVARTSEGLLAGKQSAHSLCTAWSWGRHREVEER